MAPHYIETPPMSPAFVPPSPDFFDFVMLYVLSVELVLLALPRKWCKQILDGLLPVLRRHL